MEGWLWYQSAALKRAAYTTMLTEEKNQNKVNWDAGFDTLRTLSLPHIVLGRFANAPASKARSKGATVASVNHPLAFYVPQIQFRLQDALGVFNNAFVIEVI